MFEGLWIVFIICLKGFWNLSWRCQEGILTVSGRLLDGIWKASWWCLGDAWKLFGRFGKGVWKVSEMEGVFEVLKSFCHWGGFSEFFTRFSFDSKFSWNQFFFTMEEFLFVNEWMQVCKYGMKVCNYKILQKITKVFDLSMQLWNYSHHTLVSPK